MKRKIPYLLLTVLVLVFLALRILDRSGRERSNVNSGLDRNSTSVIYTKHARCRMDCRKVTEAEVLDILRNGRINASKSDLKDKPCPTYAVEDITDDGDRLRIIFAQCDGTIKVVTAIDLNKEHQCECP